MADMTETTCKAAMPTRPRAAARCSPSLTQDATKPPPRSSTTRRADLWCPGHRLSFQDLRNEPQLEIGASIGDHRVWDNKVGDLTSA